MSTSITLTGFPWWTTDAALDALCSQHGSVVSVDIQVDKLSGKSLGVAIITFTTAEASNTAVSTIKPEDLPDAPSLKVTLKTAQDLGPKQDSKRKEPTRRNARTHQSRGNKKTTPQMAVPPPGFFPGPFYGFPPLPPGMTPPGMPPGMPTGMPIGFPPGALPPLYPGQAFPPFMAQGDKASGPKGNQKGGSSSKNDTEKRAASAVSDKDGKRASSMDRTNRREFGGGSAGDSRQGEEEADNRPEKDGESRDRYSRGPEGESRRDRSRSRSHGRRSGWREGDREQTIDSERDGSREPEGNVRRGYGRGREKRRRLSDREDSRSTTREDYRDGGSSSGRAGSGSPYDDRSERARYGYREKSHERTGYRERDPEELEGMRENGGRKKGGVWDRIGTKSDTVRSRDRNTREERSRSSRSATDQRRRRSDRYEEDAYREERREKYSRDGYGAHDKYSARYDDYARDSDKSERHRERSRSRSRSYMPNRRRRTPNEVSSALKKRHFHELK